MNDRVTVHGYLVHPYATLFPEFPAEDLEELSEDIRAHGQRDPILLCNGAILDGRNRLKACKLAGVEPRFEHLDALTPEEALHLVLSKNLHRRHLNESQRAMVGAALGSMLGMVEKKDPANLPVPRLTQAERARLMNVSERSIRSAEIVERESPELASEVSQGAISVSRAERQVRARNGNPSGPSKPKLAKSQPTKATLAPPAELHRQLVKLTDEFTADGRATPEECVHAAMVACQFVHRLLPRISPDEHARLRMRAFNLEPEECGDASHRTGAVTEVPSETGGSAIDLDLCDRTQSNDLGVRTNCRSET